MRFSSRFNFWKNPPTLPVPSKGKFNRYLISRLLHLETLEGRIVPTTYTVLNASDSGTGSLRDAITSVNNDSSTGPHTINFAINGVTGAIQTINLATALPVILNPVIIDGTTQSGYSANTLSVGAGNNASIKIQLNGSIFTPASGIVGLYLNAAGSTVKGLSIVNFPYAIYANNDNITISGNYFGVNADGTAQSNALSGVGVDVATFNSAFVGGNNASDQNIFGNLTTGIVQIAGSNSFFKGNRIGLGTANTSFMPNNIGIQINNFGNINASSHNISNNLIGKNTTGINLIGSQAGSGLVLGTTIVSNLIGTDSLGSVNNLGNGTGISIFDSQNTNINNSATTLTANTIAFSGNNGISISGANSFGNIIGANSIRNNTNLGIFIDPQSNNGIKQPVITSQVANSITNYTYNGYVKGAPNTTYIIYFYSSLVSDSRSQGADYLGFTNSTTNSVGDGTFSFNSLNQLLQDPATYVITATSSTVGSGTSQFSAGPPQSITVVSGSEQSSLIGNTYANPLVVVVNDSRGDPVLGIPVVFTAPNSNLLNPATGLFLGSQQSFSTITAPNGQATSSAITANNFVGTFTVLANTSSLPTATPSFNLTNTSPVAAPTITSFSPSTGPAGTVVTIIGTNFTGTNSVKFNGINATVFSVIDANRINASVPVTASTGPITISTPNGTVTSSASFTVPNTLASFRISPVNQNQPVFTGVPVRLKLSALNSSGGVITNYVGTVNITTTDLLAVIPTTATFTSANNGVVEITATFFTAGPVTVTVANALASGSGTGAVIQSSTGAFQTFPIPTQIPFPLGVSITKTLATVSGITQATLSDFVATINWGDGTANSTGSIIPAPDNSNTFQVLGTHTYNSLSLFTGTVTVRRISDNTSSSASFSAFVLSQGQNNQLNQVDGVRLPPGDKFATAGVPGLQTNFLQPAGNPNPVILINSSFLANPQPFSTTLPAQSFFDIRLTNPPANSFLSITLNFTGGLQRGSSPYVQFAQDNSTSYQNVISNNNLVIINYINGTITVVISASSFPLITNLAGTVFAVVLSSAQVSSNTVTVVPNSFSGGTAVSIAWGDSSTVVDVRNSSSSLTFQNSRQSTLALIPSQSANNVLLKTSKSGGTLELDIGVNPPINIIEIIKGTLGESTAVVGSIIQKLYSNGSLDFIKLIPKGSEVIKPDLKDAPAPAPNKIIPQIIENDNCFIPEDCAFNDISEGASFESFDLELDEHTDPFITDSSSTSLYYSDELNWGGLALSTVALSQLCPLTYEKPKKVYSIRISSY